MQPRTALLALLSCALAAPSLAQRAMPASTIEMSQAVEELQNTIRSQADDALVKQKSDLFGDGLPGTRINLHADLHPWRFIQERGSLNSASELIEAADHKLHNLDNGIVPPPSTMASLGLMKTMDSQGMISFGDLPTSVMGVFYTGSRLVGLSKYIPYLARRMGAAFLAQILFHEIGGHASDPNIKTGTVEENEGKAFAEQFNYLKALYGDQQQTERDGDMIVTQVLEWRQAYHDHPTVRNRVGLAMAETANALFGTQGDAKKIEELVHKLYKSDGSPSAPSA